MSFDLELANRRAVVTGGTQGIGAAVAGALLVLFAAVLQLPPGEGGVTAAGTSYRAQTMVRSYGAVYALRRLGRNSGAVREPKRHCQRVETGTAKNLSPNGTTVSWSYSTSPMMKRLPQASASLRMPEKSAPVTVAAAFASIPTT